jgi:hypothetical protein
MFSFACEGKTRLTEKVLIKRGEIDDRRRRQHEREAETDYPTDDSDATLF